LFIAKTKVFVQLIENYVTVHKHNWCIVSNNKKGYVQLIYNSNNISTEDIENNHEINNSNFKIEEIGSEKEEIGVTHDTKRLAKGKKVN
jgi:hypothetical protein